MPGRAVVGFRNAMLDTTNTYLGNSAQLRMYTGSRNATLGQLPTGTLLVTYSLGTSPFAAASNGTVTLTGLPRTATASASGTIGCAVLVDSGGSVVADWDEGDGFTVVPTSVTASQTVQLTGFSVSLPNP